MREKLNGTANVNCVLDVFKNNTPKLGKKGGILSFKRELSFISQNVAS